MARRQDETVLAAGGFAADAAKAAAIGMAARGTRKSLTAQTAPAPGAPTYASSPSISSKPLRSPERAAAVLDRASRMRAFRPSFLDARLFDRQMRTPSPIATSKLGNLNTLPHDSLQYHGVHEVPLKAVKSDQKTVSVKAVKGKLANAAAPAPAGKLPLVLKQGGTYRVIDGNHRLTAQRLLGQSAANVRVVTLKGSADAAQMAGQAADTSKMLAAAQSARDVRKGLTKGQAANQAPSQPVAKTGPARGPGGRFISTAKVAGGVAAKGVGTAAKVGTAANPFILAGMGAAAASSAYVTARDAGASKLQAAGVSAAAAAPMAVGAALPTLLGRITPKAGAALAKVALPLTAAAAGVAAVRKGYEAYEKGGSVGQIAGAAAMGAADNLTFGLAGRGLNWLTGSAHATGGADPVTHRIAAAAGQVPAKTPVWSGHQMASENRATSAELNNSPLDARNVAAGGIHTKAQDFYGRADAALHASRVKRGIQSQPWPNQKNGQGGNTGRSTSFDRANQAYQTRQAGGQAIEPAQDTGPGAPWGGKRKGWSNAARIAAAKARGIEKLPYGGDPNAGPSEWAPGGQSS